jgi:hypothetical protein
MRQRERAGHARPSPAWSAMCREVQSHSVNPFPNGIRDQSAGADCCISKTLTAAGYVATIPRPRRGYRRGTRPAAGRVRDPAACRAPRPATPACPPLRFRRMRAMPLTITLPSRYVSRTRRRMRSRPKSSTPEAAASTPHGRSEPRTRAKLPELPPAIRARPDGRCARRLTDSTRPIPTTRTYNVYGLV